MDTPDSLAANQPVTPDDVISPPPSEPQFQLSDSERKRAKMMLQLQGAQQFFMTISKGLMKIMEDLSSHLIKR